MSVETLVGAVTADGRISCDGLRASHHHDGYTVSLPDRTWGSLSAAKLRDVVGEHPDYVDNWHHWEREVRGHGSARRAFLRWVEDADDRPVPERYDALRSGIERGWGELRIRATLTDGERVYEVRNAADADVDRGELDEFTDPLAARELVKRDDDGGYRPLKTAPTLPTGWIFRGLDGADLVQTVDFVYPATVANWHRERRGELDVTHFRECAERQTGIYDVVDELEPAAVEWLAEATCVDSQCLRRREWDEDADSDLHVPRGEGAFPCREPCSLVVAAARKIATLETEEPRSYTFELTPSEKAQLEAILDAVAEGRVGEIREADLNDAANRYRVRYLRAKRLSEAGLSDVPTFDGD